MEGLSAEDIGEWIRLVREIELPLIPDLQRIRNDSAGLPLLLDEWINNKSKDLNYEQINRDKLCNRILKQERGLSDDDLIKLYKLSILFQPLKDEDLAKFLQIENVDYVRPFIKRLIERGIFKESYKWFRHELVQKCFEDDLEQKEKKRYHARAASLYLSL